MKKSLLLLTIISVIGLASIGCDMGATRSTSDADQSKTKMTDSDLETAIKAKLNSDEQLRAAKLDVDANADRSQATLSGTVTSETLRTRAVELTKSAHAGLVVTDKIDVKPLELTRATYTEENAREQRARAKDRGETVGSSLDDAWIHTKIVSKLIGNPDTPQRKINVDVNNNVVTLRGTVSTPAEKAEAEQVAKSTEGVKQVINQIKISKA